MISRHEGGIYKIRCLIWKWGRRKQEGAGKTKASDWVTGCMMVRVTELGKTRGGQVWRAGRWDVDVTRDMSVEHIVRGLSTCVSCSTEICAGE